MKSSVLLRRQQPESLDATARALREGARRKVGALESRWRKKRVVLERAREEFVRNLQYLKALQEEGRYPVNQLAPAILREELRLQHLESELKKLDEAFRLAKEKVYRSARLKVAKMAARSGLALDLDRLFPEVKDESPGDAAEHQG